MSGYRTQTFSPSQSNNTHTHACKVGDSILYVRLFQSLPSTAMPGINQAADIGFTHLSENQQKKVTHIL